jgi:hypothetical protein
MPDMHERRLRADPTRMSARILCKVSGQTAESGEGELSRVPSADSVGRRQKYVSPLSLISVPERGGSDRKRPKQTTSTAPF